MLRDEIGEIDIFDSFSFFEIDKNFSDLIQSSFQKNKPVFNNRKAVIEITKKDPSSEGKRGKKRRDRKDNKPTGFGRKRRRK